MANRDNKQLTSAEKTSLSGTGNDAIGSFISSAANSLTNEQKSEIATIAAQEKIRLEAKAIEQSLDYEHAKRQIDDHKQAFENLDRSGSLTRHKLSTDVKSGAGTTKIESKAGASCFIATAAFDGESHETVKKLRRWRDSHLIRTRLGRTFVSLYWRIGPRVAPIVSNHIYLKDRTRTALTWLAAKLPE